MTDWGQVLAAFRDGDSAAIHKISRVVATYLARLGAYNDRSRCDDISQDVLLRLHRSADRIDDPTRLLGWLHTTTRRALLDALKRDPKIAASAELDEVPADPARSADELLGLRRAIEQLPAGERRVIAAIYLEGMKFQEAAAKLDLPEGTLRTLRTRAVKRLRESMLTEELKSAR